MTAKTKKAKTDEPEMTLEEIRAELAGEEKEVFITLSKAKWEAPSFLKDKSPDEIAEHLKQVAEEANFPKEFKLDNRSIPVVKPQRTYSYSTHKYVTREAMVKEGPYWVLVAYEPYTDEELQKRGVKLVAAKKRREAAAAKKLQKKVSEFNLKARELGQPTITVEDLA